MYVQDVVATAAAMHAFGGLYKSCMLGEKTESWLWLWFAHY